MHRSGTSALAGVLDLLDVYLGSELMEATCANEKGYFENNILYKINEELLSQINSSWDDVFYDEVKLESLKGSTKLKNVIKNEFEYAEIFAIKDPRLAFLFPVYEKALNELNVEIKIIIPFRNPVEVASSLHKRDGMVLEKGMLLWAYHFLMAEKFSRGYERVFVAFDELMTDAQVEINNISLKLNLDLNGKYVENKKEIDEFLEPGLKHHNISMDDFSGNTPEIIKKVLFLKEKLNDADLTREFDNLRNSFFSYQSLFYNNDIVNSLNDGLKAKHTLQKNDVELRQAKQNLQEKDVELHQAKQGLQENDSEIRLLRQSLSAKDAELNQAKLNLRANDVKLSQTKQKLQEIDGGLNQANQLLQAYLSDIDDLKTELTNIYLSKSWKATKVLRRLMRFMKK